MTMMNNPFVLAGILVVTAVIVVMLMVWKMRARKLSGDARATMEEMFRAAKNLQDPVRRVMEGDSVLDAALTRLGYGGSLGEKLKKAGPRFSDIDAVWRAHKLRNRLAHEAGARVAEQEANNAMAAFAKAMQDLY